MTNPANDIVKQAKQGSVAAIIQVLNDKLADSGVRTRAIFADGVLQLLCEAATTEQLEPSTLIERVRQILEAIAPRNIRRVNINSRIVREQQLLWLEEISRDPENQLLWSKEITLKKPGLLKQLADEWRSRQEDLAYSVPSQASPRQLREQRQFWRGITGGALVSFLVLAGGWWAYSRFNATSSQPEPDTVAKASSSTTDSPASQVSSPAATTPNSTSADNPDPFARAVTLATQASDAGQVAKSSAEWLSLAARWQEASDWMAKVPPSDNRYTLAQDRVIRYREKSEVALQEARRKQAEVSSDALAPSAQ
ncbi:hypothetical protein ACN4EK_29510 [Pantanalinema rosaneae CENA516]|uniref:hypothetical protein n=1 Tax=Pantanalinema rosaneae TaxID=1620701 RepID=UPI003D6EB7EE